MVAFLIRLFLKITQNAWEIYLFTFPWEVLEYLCIITLAS